MTKICKCVCFAMAFVLSAAFVTPARAFERGDGFAYSVSSKIVREKRGALELTGELPVFLAPGDAPFTAALNDAAEAVYAEAVARASGRGRLTFSYSTREFNGVTSTVILIEEQNGASGTVMARSVNFNAQLKRLFTLNDVLGVNGAKLANRALKEEIAANIDRYNAAFDEFDENQAFYYENDVVTLIFDKYAVAPGFRGLVYFTLELARVVSVISDDSYIKPGFNIRMCRLRPVAEAFGYGLEWRERFTSKGAVTRSVVVTKDEAYVAEFVIGEYGYLKGKTRGTFEAAPEIVNDSTYVPMAFFDNVLGASYSYDASGKGVVFSKYVR